MKYIKLFENFNNFIFDIDEIVKWGDVNGWNIPYIESTTNSNEEYLSNLKKEIKLILDDFKVRYKNLDNIPLFRVVSLESIDRLNFDKLGHSWASEMDNYRYYMKTLNDYKQNTMFMIEATTSYANIDWNTSIYQNMLSSGESELVVIKDNDKVINIMKVDKIKE